MSSSSVGSIQIRHKGAAKIVRAALALRNRNGGNLIIGFDDHTLKPIYVDMPTDVRASFHVDKIQALISRYASEIFEVSVNFVEFQGREHPVISIPEGVRTPVAAKKELKDGKKTLVRQGAVYFRTLGSNGTPSTSEARPGDWKEITEVCFENREADIGRFLRRQLSGPDRSALVEVLTQFSLDRAAVSQPSLENKAGNFLRFGNERFRQAVSQRTLSSDEQAAIDRGSWSVALIIDPPRSNVVPDQVFRATLAGSNPQYTGWPVWLDSTSFSDPASRPHVTQGGLEALIFSIGSEWGADHLEFMRLDPKGDFYLRRILQDDLSSKVAPGTALEPVLSILRVAEAIAVGIAFTRALGWEAESTRLGFAFKWTKLRNRQLRPWANPMLPSLIADIAHDDEVTCFVDVPLETPVAAIAPYVETVVRCLFVLFDGYTINPETIEYWVQRLIERRL